MSRTSKGSARANQRKVMVWLVAIGLTVVGLVLSACGSRTASTVTGDGSGANETVTLAYDPTDGTLLKADHQGLFRRRAHSGWENINVPQASGLSGVIVNPDQPATLYVSGPGLGVLRSDDGGQNWRAVNAGLPSLDVAALALHSFRRETLYVWLNDDGIYSTEDGGANWKRMPDQGPPDTHVRGLTHSTLPGSMNTGWLYAATPTGAYLSMDCF